MFQSCLQIGARGPKATLPVAEGASEASTAWSAGGNIAEKKVGVVVATGTTMSSTSPNARGDQRMQTPEESPVAEALPEGIGIKADTRDTTGTGMAETGTRGRGAEMMTVTITNVGAQSGAVAARDTNAEGEEDIFSAMLSDFRKADVKNL